MESKRVEVNFGGRLDHMLETSILVILLKIDDMDEDNTIMLMEKYSMDNGRTVK